MGRTSMTIRVEAWRRVRTGKEHEQVTAAVGNAVDTRQRQQVRNEIADRNTLPDRDR